VTSTHTELPSYPLEAPASAALLDRALADRPGALRLVGVSVSNLEVHQQLVLG